MERTPSPPGEAGRLLEWALLFTFVCHGAAMVGMALLLAPMLPGGGGGPDPERVAQIAAHPWLFRLGWLPWHITALSDLILAVAMLRHPALPRGPTWVSALLTVAAVFPDQGGQFLWITRGVELAQLAASTGDPASLRAYLDHEQHVFSLTAAWGASLYVLGAIAWSVSFARAGLWSAALTRLSVPLWTLFIAVGVAPLLPADVRPPPAAVAAGNALGFVGLQAWFWLVGEQVLRLRRPDTPHGRLAPWRAPRPGAWGKILEFWANSRFARGLCEWLPVLSFRSDITDVIYVNYLVEADRLRACVPEGLELQVIGGKYAVFSFLTYRHGHFGPSLLGPLRALWPSPVQSNWRVHVRDPRTGKEGIYFLTNAVTTTIHALGARLMAEGAPMHRAASGDLRRDPSGDIDIDIDPGQGSCPDVHLRLRPSSDRGLPAPWSEVFADRDAMLGYITPQDRAIATQPWRQTTSRAEIHLGIPISACEPLEGEVRSRAAEALVGDARPICFRVARVDFEMTSEQLDRWTERSS